MQNIGIAVTVVAVLILAWWIWNTWFKNAAVGQTTTGKVVSATLDTAKLAVNLGYIEILSKIDVIKASPQATNACDVLANTLWQGAIKAWKDAQVEPVAPEPVANTAKVATTDGTIVEVPVK
jgi:hypothetical protein